MEQEARAWLLKIRQTKQLTTYAAAKACGISQTYFSQIEHGKRNVPVPTAKKIGAALGFDWKRFYE